MFQTHVSITAPVLLPFHQSSMTDRKSKRKRVDRSSASESALKGSMRKLWTRCDKQVPVTPNETFKVRNEKVAAEYVALRQKHHTKWFYVEDPRWHPLELEYCASIPKFVAPIPPPQAPRRKPGRPSKRQLAKERSDAQEARAAAAAAQTPVVVV
jgi:hypothetical protein